MWGVIGAFALTTVVNIGTVAYFLGGLKQTVVEHERRLNTLEPKIDRINFAPVKGE